MARVIAIVVPLAIVAVLGVGGTVALSALKPEPEKADEARIGLNVFAEPIRITSYNVCYTKLLRHLLYHMHAGMMQVVSVLPSTDQMPMDRNNFV